MTSASFIHLRRARLVVAALAALVLAALLPALARADVQASGLRLDAVDPGRYVTVMRPDGTPITGVTKLGRMVVRTPTGSTNTYVGYCVDPDRPISPGSSYDVIQSWDGTPSGGTNDLPPLNGKRDELAWLVYHTDDLLDAAADQRNARGAALQILVWQLLGKASQDAPVDTLNDPDVAAQLDQVRQALDARAGGNVAQGLGLGVSATQASVCGGPASVTATVSGTPGAEATVEIESEPSPQTARISGGEGVSVAPDGRSAIVVLGPAGRRDLTLTGATAGQVTLKATARGLRLIHWRGQPGTSSEGVQHGVYGLRGFFGQRITVAFLGCGAAPAAPAPAAAQGGGLQPAYIATPARPRLAFALRGPRLATTGQVVTYRLRVVNTSPRLTAQRIRIRIRMPIGLGLPRGQRWTSMRLQLIIQPNAAGFRRAEATLSAQNAGALHRTVTMRVSPGRAPAPRAVRRTAPRPAAPTAPAPVAGAAAAGASAWR